MGTMPARWGLAAAAVLAAAAAVQSAVPAPALELPARGRAGAARDCAQGRCEGRMVSALLRMRGGSSFAALEDEAGKGAEVCASRLACVEHRCCVCWPLRGGCCWCGVIQGRVSCRRRRPAGRRVPRRARRAARRARRSPHRIWRHTIRPRRSPCRTMPCSTRGRQTQHQVRCAVLALCARGAASLDLGPVAGPWA